MKFVRLFQSRFAALVASGAKTQTIRPVPKRMPKPGDVIDCREWMGKPRRSKQRKLGDFTITEVFSVTMNWGGAWWRISRDVGEFMHLDALAKRDGFADWSEMAHWFECEHGLPFSGILIRWEQGQPC